MFDKRLLKLVPKARFLIAVDVFLQWIALMANIAVFVVIGFFLQQLLDGRLELSNVVTLLMLAIGALFVRFGCQMGAQRFGQKAAQTAKTTIRQAVYNKLTNLGPAYRESISTGEALQISVEGVEHLESYFGLYLPQLFYAVLAPLTLFICLAPFSFPTALTLFICVPFIPLSIVAVQKIAKRVMGQYWGTYTDLGAMFLESIQGLSTLKVFRPMRLVIQNSIPKQKHLDKQPCAFWLCNLTLLRLWICSHLVARQSELLWRLIKWYKGR